LHKRELQEEEEGEEEGDGNRLMAVSFSLFYTWQHQRQQFINAIQKQHQ